MYIRIYCNCYALTTWLGTNSLSKLPDLIPPESATFFIFSNLSCLTSISAGIARIFCHLMAKPTLQISWATLVQVFHMSLKA